MREVANKNAALILAFRRVNQIEKIIDSLVNGGIKKLYVSIDGPRNTVDQNEQILLLDIIARNRDRFTKVKIQNFASNLGIGEAVIRGLDWFFENEPEGIVIEDDLEFGVDFIDFAFEGLEKYRNDSEVWMICGTNPFDSDLKSAKTLWTTYTMIWGWASWRYKWEEMRRNLISTPLPRSALTLKEINYWKVGAKRVLSGKVDTWDTPLAAASHFIPKYCALPPHNLVSNQGFGEKSTNTRSLEFPLGLPIDKLPPNWIWEEDRVISALTTDYLINAKVFHINFKHIFIPIYGKILDKIRFKKLRKNRPLIERLSLRNRELS